MCISERATKKLLHNSSLNSISESIVALEALQDDDVKDDESFRLHAGKLFHISKLNSFF